MYPHFIEINNTDLGGKNIVNIESIAFVCGDDEAQIILNIADRDDNTIDCKESYDELKKLITDSGCLINKGDPRLDSKPLTIDDFKGLVGQPVYSINDNRWYIVHWFSVEEHDYKCAYLYSDEGVQVWWDAEKLIAKPLYRMKVGG